MINHMKPINIIAYTDNYKLSPHFTYGEMTISQTAIRFGIDNTPTETDILNMKTLCVDVLEPIRKHFGIVSINSGFRCNTVNILLAGSKKSQHRYGQAADFHCSAATINDIFEWVILESNIVWDQVIQEFSKWLHISYVKDGVNRKKITTAQRINNNVVYKHYSKEDIKRNDYQRQ